MYFIKQEAAFCQKELIRLPGTQPNVVCLQNPYRISQWMRMSYIPVLVGINMVMMFIMPDSSKKKMRGLLLPIL